MSERASGPRHRASGRGKARNAPRRATASIEKKSAPHNEHEEKGGNFEKNPKKENARRENPKKEGLKRKADGPNNAMPRFRVLSRVIERLRGLNGIKNENEYAVLIPCCDIHTFGMRVPIDAAFVDATGMVVAVHRRVMPGRRIRHGDARLVVERPFQAGKWLECGDGFFNGLPRT